MAQSRHSKLSNRCANFIFYGETDLPTAYTKEEVYARFGSNHIQTSRVNYGNLVLRIRGKTPPMAPWVS